MAPKNLLLKLFHLSFSIIIWSPQIFPNHSPTSEKKKLNLTSVPVSGHNPQLATSPTVGTHPHPFFGVQKSHPSPTIQSKSPNGRRPWSWWEAFVGPKGLWFALDGAKGFGWWLPPLYNTTPFSITKGIYPKYPKVSKVELDKTKRCSWFGSPRFDFSLIDPVWTGIQNGISLGFSLKKNSAPL